MFFVDLPPAWQHTGEWWLIEGVGDAPDTLLFSTPRLWMQVAPDVWGEWPPIDEREELLPITPVNYGWHRE